ncbi:MAG: hypothetical protein ACTS3F_07215 [Phycisphaerales bacterium]
MKKYILIPAGVALLLVAGVVTLHLMRPKAPDRDYMAEFDAMIAQRFPNGSRGADTFEVLAALDRYDRARSIAETEAKDAYQWGVDQGLEMNEQEWFNEMLISDAVLYRHEHRAWIDSEAMGDEASAAVKLVLARARERAWPQIRAVLEDPEALRILRAFNEHQVVVLPPPDAPSIFDRESPHLAQARTNAFADNLLFTESADPGMRREAIASILGNARLAGATPTIVPGLGMASMESIATETVLKSINQQSLHPGEARTLLAEFLKHRSLRPEPAWYFEGEALMMLDLIETFYTPRPGVSGTPSIATAPIIGISHGAVYQIFDEFFARQIQQAKQPAPRRDLESVDENSFVRSIDRRAREPFGILLVTFEPVILTFDRSEADLAGAITALAIAAYMEDHNNTPPPTLASLVPEYLPELPVDPFAADPGAPLVYRVTDDGQVLLYSLGRDLIDDRAEAQDLTKPRNARRDRVYWPWEPWRPE